MYWGFPLYPSLEVAPEYCLPHIVHWGGEKMGEGEVVGGLTRVGPG